MATPRRGDRLSALGDAALTRVLSHLPTNEAVRTSILSRRWRDLHTAVPVIDFIDPKKGNTWGAHHGHQPMCFEQMVTCALLTRDPTAPIRALRLDSCHPTVTVLVQCILIALKSGAEELDIKLRCQESSRLRLCPFGQYDGCSANFDEGDVGRYVRMPAAIFRSATLRHLSLSRWTLEYPQDVSFMSLETLVLHRIMGSAESLRRLVSSCSQLTDLRLEECPGATTITVTSARLRRFAMVCCHNARHVTLNSRRLHTLRYKGGLPPTTSFIWIANYGSVTAMAIDICEEIDCKTPRQIAPVTELIGRCSNLEFLHLALRPAMACYSSLFARAVRLLPRLTYLDLKGCLHNEHSVGSVSALLQNTPNLQVLSLFLLLPDPPKKKENYFDDMDIELEKDKGDDKEACYGGYVQVPREVWTATVRCFNHRLRRISLADYSGRPFERMLARFLLSKAYALEELSVSLGPKCSAHRAGIETELKNWRFTRYTRVTFV